MLSPHRYFVLHKPYGMESQFIANYDGPLLGDIGFPFPVGTHAIGRLDKPSEGLLLLSTNKKITKLLFESSLPHRRTYQVQVKNKVTAQSLAQLRDGVSIRLSGNIWYTTPQCEAEFALPPPYPSPLPNVYPDKATWLRLTLTEGKYRQVRKMVMAIRHPCLRLLRTSIEDMELGNLRAGEVREMGEDEFFEKLKLERTAD